MRCPTPMVDCAAAASAASLETESASASASKGLKEGGVDVTFQGLTVTLGGGQAILRGASGCIRAGELTALLGPSGAGKTTFLDALAGRSYMARIEGKMRYGKHKPTPSVLQHMLAYVEQQDALVPNLSVQEMLAYACELRAPPGTPASVARVRAEEMMSQLGLQSCRHTLIGGGHLRGASGGQRRRVSIGVALAASPAVLLLDEPTSGLDSRAALEVVDVLRQQADCGLTVLASVHQPSERLLSRFGELLMAAGGQLVYQGPNGPEAKQFLMELFPQTAAQLDASVPRPDWLLDCLEQAERSGELAERLEVSPNSPPASSCCEQPPSWQQLASEDGPARHRGLLACSWILVKYRMRANYRSAYFLVPRIVDKLGLAFLMSTLFLGMGGMDGFGATTSIINLLFMFITLAGFSAAGFISTLMLETELFARERHAGLYPIISYLLAKMVEELTVLLLTSVVLTTAVFYLAQLSGSLVLLWLTYFCSLATGIALAYLCAAVSLTIDQCVLMLAGIVIAKLFFVGLIMAWRNIPAYWKWFGCINYLHYAWGTGMINEFSAAPRQIGSVDVLEYFSLDGKSAWGMLGVQCAFFGAYVLLAWGALVLREALPRWRRALARRGSSKLEQAGSKASGDVEQPAGSVPANPTNLPANPTSMPARRPLFS